MTEKERMRLLMAVHALMKAVERSLMAETYEGIADTMVQNYRDLHTKLVELLPDDYYVTTVLSLKIPEGAEDRQKVALVQLATNQLVTYLETLSSEEQAEEDAEEGDFGREMSDEILRFTRETLRRALSSIDIDFGPPPPPPPPPHFRHRRGAGGGPWGSKHGFGYGGRKPGKQWPEGQTDETEEVSKGKRKNDEPPSSGDDFV